MNIDSMPTGDAERDARNQKMYVDFHWPTASTDHCFRSIKRRLKELQKKKDRRAQRERYKKGTSAAAINASGSAMSPDGDASENKDIRPTQRKCANCGQQGHIKTNKKCVLCGLSYYKKQVQKPKVQKAPESSLWSMPDTFV